MPSWESTASRAQRVPFLVCKRFLIQEIFPEHRQARLSVLNESRYSFLPGNQGRLHLVRSQRYATALFSTAAFLPGFSTTRWPLVPFVTQVSRVPPYRSLLN